MMCTSCGSFLKALSYDYNLKSQMDYIMLLVKENNVLLVQVRCHCINGVGVCGRMWSGWYILSLPYSVIDVKYCNHLLAVDMAGAACRGLWRACGWKNVKRYRNGSP